MTFAAVTVDFAVFSTIASFVLAIVAIVLSILFYRWSTQLAEKTVDAANKISASVDRVEELFSRMYTDTFGMVKDTWTDLRQHAWGGGSDGMKDNIVDDKLADLRQQMEDQLQQVLQKVDTADGKYDTLKNEFEILIDKAITETRKVETDADLERFTEYLAGLFGNFESGTFKVGLKVLLQFTGGTFSSNEVEALLEKLRDRGFVTWDDGKLRLNTRLILDIDRFKEWQVQRNLCAHPRSVNPKSNRH